MLCREVPVKGRVDEVHVAIRVNFTAQRVRLVIHRDTCEKKQRGFGIMGFPSYMLLP